MTTNPLPFPPPLACADVDQRLADYLDNELPTALAPAERAAVDRHLTTCDRCRALVDDLHAVTRAAAALPPLAPSRDLWDGIAARLGAQESAAPSPADAQVDDVQPRVLPFDVRHVRRPAPGHAAPGAGRANRARPGAPRPAAAHGVTWSTRRLASAAVALVTATAGTTYVLARGTPAPAGTLATTSPNATISPNVGTPNDRMPGAPARDAQMPNDLAQDTQSSGHAPTSAPAGRVAAGPPRAESLDRALTARRRGAAPADLRAVTDAAVPGAAVYDREIASLRAAVRDRRGDLDSATVAVLVRNLTIIDQAIAQSRAALARDPHSPFLGDQLTRALGQKVDLLRTAALMPRT